MVYAYARVSTADQNPARQYEAFRRFGVCDACIFTDRKSGSTFDRQAYKRLLRRLSPGDLLVVESIDRLGRSYQGIIREWRRITEEIGADIAVLDMPLLDTRDVSGNGLMRKFISGIVLEILSFVAENERENIRRRQAEGIAAAKARGVRFGRTPTVFSSEQTEVFDLYIRHEISCAAAAARLGMQRSNFFYHLRRYRMQISQKA